MPDQKHQPLNPELKATLPTVNVNDLVVAIKYYVDEDFAHIQVRAVSYTHLTLPTKRIV